MKIPDGARPGRRELEDPIVVALAALERNLWWQAHLRWWAVLTLEVTGCSILALSLLAVLR